MFKTKRYYKKCLAMQIENNKIINQKFINFKQDVISSNININEKVDNYKKEIKTLKSKVTKLTNQIKKMKEEN